MKESIIRIQIMRIFAAVVVLLLVYNLFHVQIVEGERWSSMAESNRFRRFTQVAPRGSIYTADGVVLATNIKTYDIALSYEHDRQLREQAITTLCSLLGLEYEAVASKLAGHRRKFEPVVVARNVSFEQIVILEEHRYLIPGLVVQVNPRRYFPQSYLFSQPLGRVTPGDYTGVSGLERQWNDYLQGRDGSYIIQVNANHVPIGEPVYDQEAVPGQNLHLTLDAELQQVAQDSLRRVLQKLRDNGTAENAWAGAVVVIDPNTGRILAMVSEPTFDVNDPNSFARGGIVYPEEVPAWAQTHGLDRTYNYRKPIGSTMKMLTGMAALETGLVTARESLRCTGHTRIANQPTQCYARTAHGNVDMIRAIQVSCNIYFGNMGHRMGRDVFYEYLEIFGMGWERRNAGFTDIPYGEQRDALDYRLRDTWFGGHNVQIAYGQLNEFTPLQLANYIAMIANGGIHYKPYLVETITDYQGEIVEHFQPTIINAYDFDPANMETIRRGMLAAAQGGHMRGVAVPTAGKTGTAEDSSPPGDAHSWWVGYGPYDEPEIVVVVFMERGGLGLRAAEVGRDIFDFWYENRQDDN